MHQKCNISATFWFSEKFYNSFSPDTYRKKAQYLLCHKNLMEGNKTANKLGIRFFDSPCSYMNIRRKRKFKMHTGSVSEIALFMVHFQEKTNKILQSMSCEYSNLVPQGA